MLNRVPGLPIELPSSESSEIRELRNRVESHLEGLGEPLLVFIDDIDRLTPQEILAVFQLVKATADFPNVTYLLIYDEVAVEQALVNQGIDARAYLEKIVQVNLHCPRPNRTILTDMIDRSIDAVIGHLPADSWDSARWQQVLYGLHPLFRNVRDIRRFANSVGFHLRLLRGEVDPVDLIALETLRMFAPMAHRRLGESKEYFPGLSSTQEGADFAAAHKRVSEAFPETAPPALSSLLKYLFPRLDNFAGRDYAEASRCKRAWHEEYFDRYWEFAPGPGEVPDDEIKGLLERSGDEIEGRLIEYVESDRISYVLDRLGFLAEPLTSAHPLIHAVLQISPRLDSHKTIWTGGHDDVRMARVAAVSLPDHPDARKEALAALLQAVPSVSGLVLLFAWEERVRERVAEGGLEQPHLDKAQFDELRPSLVELIRRAARNGILAADPWYFRILYCWKRWSSLEDVRSEVARETATDAELVAYVDRGIQTGVSSTGLIHRLSVAAVSEFLGVDKARERLRAVRETGSLPLTAREQVAIDMFLDGREEATEDEESRLAEA